jgi:hypothetical protein
LFRQYNSPRGPSVRHGPLRLVGQSGRSTGLTKIERPTYRISREPEGQAQAQLGPALLGIW